MHQPQITDEREGSPISIFVHMTKQEQIYLLPIYSLNDPFKHGMKIATQSRIIFQNQGNLCIRFNQRLISFEMT